MKQVQFPCLKCNAGTQELFMEGEEQPIHSYFICRCDEMNKYRVGDKIMIDIEKPVYSIVTKVEGSQVWFLDPEDNKSYSMQCDDPNLHLIGSDKWREIKDIDIISPPTSKIKPFPMTNLKPLFGFGLFIRKDDFGNDCCVGDIVEVIRPEMQIPEDSWEGSKITTIPEVIFTGTLVLLKSQGVRIRLNTGIGTEYIKPPITNRSRNIWKWRKL
jgi:hypothetical protein